MTLIEFIKSLVTKDSRLGDLAEDVMGDKNFPYDQPEERVVSYLRFVLGRRNNDGVFEELMAAYEVQKETPLKLTDLHVKFAPMKAERWEFLKANFPCDRVITVGEYGDIYRIYAVDAVGETAIKFDVYAKHKLTELSMVDVRNIYFGDLTKELTVQQALDQLAANHFSGTREPTQPNYSEMIGYLKSQLKDPLDI
ncbi:hypothetical protein [Pedobacter frigoris]|uniref:YozE SAM-like domain-containing protein n=1 Tax=Pedobacter frigoris TaxID=2571272 RepID=A0A4U1CGK2_9SPHI|nr:hypothetical protein [Pedobacter frigoris]TKC04236.1 hypothetical protein FA047_16705 [Pedobacter frigoris]